MTLNYNIPSNMHNQLLAALPLYEFNRISSGLELVEMPLGEVLCESNEKLNHGYFPMTAIISLVYVLENGATAEIASIGNEGKLGFSLLMGGNTTTSFAVVQSAGYGYRLKASLLLT